MKRVYSKPVLETKAFAQFENVFTACNKNPGNHTSADFPGMPCSICEHPENFDNGHSNHNSLSGS